MAERTYTAGLPVVVTVDDDGTVTFDVDLSEIREGMDAMIYAPEVEDWAQVARDLDAADQAAGELGWSGRVTQATVSQEVTS